MTRIPLARPWTDQAELDALARVLASGQLSRGPELEQFESAMARLAATRGAVGVNSGTIGLQIAMKAFGIGPGDEVITVSYTFIGTLNAIVHAGATPVLVDIDPHTLNIDPHCLAAAITPRTRAILVVHLFGRPAPMNEILALARPRGLRVIEDACEALGTRYGDRPVGGLGDAGVFGFYPNKPITTGEGGMIVADDAEFLERCSRLRNQGFDARGESRPNDGVGYSARLSELHAAIGNVQLTRLAASLELRQSVADLYNRLLADEAGLELPAPPAASDRHAWFTYPLRLRAADTGSRDQVIARLAEAGIQSGRYFLPVHQIGAYARRFEGLRLPVTEDVGRRSIGLPLYPQMTPAETTQVCDALKQALRHIPIGFNATDR